MSDMSAGAYWPKIRDRVMNGKCPVPGHEDERTTTLPPELGRHAVACPHCRCAWEIGTLPADVIARHGSSAALAGRDINGEMLMASTVVGDGDDEGLQGMSMWPSAFDTVTESCYIMGYIVGQLLRARSTGEMPPDVGGI